MLPYKLLPLILFSLRQAPVGTELHVRLVTPVGSYASKPGNPLSAVLIAPVIADGQTVLPAGSLLSGSVQRVAKIGFGIVHETATLVLKFNEVTLPDGETFPLGTLLTDVDNSRERVISDGSIRGVRGTASIAYRFSGYVRTALMWEVHARLAFWAIKTLLIQVPEPEIYYPSGVELTLTLSEPMYAKPQPESGDAAGRRLSERARDVLEPMVDDMPVRTQSQNSNREADLINMMFIGSREEISRAFTAAGWTQATMPSMQSRFLGMRAIVEGRGYRAAPMSMLLVNDEPPGMFWQKGLNNMAKRHHIRIWKQAKTWNGEEIWIGAATHDIGFAYLRHGLAVTHKIEENIDRERDKIVHDVEFASCADVTDYVERHVPHFARSATGDPMETDGRIAFVHLNECTEPHIPQWVDGRFPLHGNPFQRIIRRQILSLRSDFYRQNMYWRTYEGTRWLVASIRNHRRANNPKSASEPKSSNRITDRLFDKVRNSSWVR